MLRAVLSNPTHKLVAFDIATTGYRRQDEIFQLAAWTADATFLQYMMPIKQLTMFAIRRYEFGLVLFQRKRRLFSVNSNEIIETKSEEQVFHNFVGWLTQLATQNGPLTQLILLYHGKGHFIPHMLIKAIQVNNLLGPFCKIVKCFANNNHMAKCMLSAENIDYMSLNYLASLNRGSDGNVEEFTSLAAHRAKLLYAVAMDFIEIECLMLNKWSNLFDILAPYAKSVADHLAEMAPFELRDRIKSFRPLLSNNFTISQRIRFYKLSVQLAEWYFDLETLRFIWCCSGIAGLRTAFQETLDMDGVRERQVIKFLNNFFKNSNVMLRK